MSGMLPPPVRNTRATVSPPSPVLTPVEREAAAFAQDRGAAAPTQAASPAPAPQPETAAVPRPRQIPRSFLGIDFTAGAVVSDTGDQFAIHPADMPKLLDFAFRVAMNALQDDVAKLRESLGLPDGGEPDAVQEQGNAPSVQPGVVPEESGSGATSEAGAGV